jgi:hypothetical protein
VLTGETVVGTIILGFIMVGTAITFLSRGKIELGSGREVRGGPLLFISLFLILPMPICLAAGFMEGEKAEKQAVPVDVYIKQNEKRMYIEEYAIFAGCLLLAGMFAVIGARPIEHFRRKERVSRFAIDRPDLDDHFRRFSGHHGAGEEQGEAAPTHSNPDTR